MKNDVHTVADCYGNFGRRHGRLMMRPIVGLPHLSKMLTLSMLSFTLIGIGRATAGDPRYAPIEARLATLPKINVPTIVIHGAVDDVNPPQKSEGHQKYFTGHYQRRLFENVGHNPPQEAPRAFAEAILDLCNHP